MKKKAEWGLMNVAYLIFVVGIVFFVIKAGKEQYQPYVKAQAKIIMEKEKEYKEEYEQNKITLQEYEQKLALLDTEEKEFQLKCDALYVYFKSLPNGAGKLDGTEKDWVYYAIKNGLDYKRPPSISLWETCAWEDKGFGIGHGRSIAIQRQLNVSGINLQDRERKIMNVQGYTANLKTYQNIEESIMATCRKLKDYKEWYGAETLSQIKQKYCPDSDPRSANNGGSYGDNTKWLDGTIKHYKAIEKIENRLREERGL